MPAENLEEEGLPKNPDLELAQLKYQLTQDAYKNDGSIKQKLMDAVEKDNMARFYEDTCNEMSWPIDRVKLQKMKDENKKKLSELEEKIEDAEKNQGETEIRDAMLAKAEFLCKIGEKDDALTAFRLTFEKTVSLGMKLDLIFHQIRIGLFYMDHDLITRNLEKAQELIESGGDWDRKNRLKVYNGLYQMSIRNFAKAAELFLDTVATFTSYELMSYQTFVTYTVYCSMIALARPKLREKVVKGSEILEVLHSLPEVYEFLMALTNCQYASFFANLAKVEQKIKMDRYLYQHYRFYVREMRVLAYAQLLQSYQSLTLTYMAKAFGVTPEFIDRELARFIAAGRLHAKIDKVNGIVETNRPDSKNQQYQNAIKQGDLLLNRIQKLSRVINI